MEKIKVYISWLGDNYGASFGDNVPGAVVLTAKNNEELLKEIPETLEFHVQGIVDDGDDVPEWLRKGDYSFEYHFDTAALLHFSSSCVPLATLSRVTGINQSLLSHYASGLKRPRELQKKRITDGLHQIGRQLMSINA